MFVKEMEKWTNEVVEWLSDGAMKWFSDEGCVVK